MSSEPKDPYRYFRIEARELLGTLSQEIIALESSATDATSVVDLETVLRAAHTLKGAAGVVRHQAIAKLSHKLEGELTGMTRLSADADQRRAVVSSILAILDAMNREVAILDAPVAPPRAAPEQAPTTDPSPQQQQQQQQESVRLDLKEVDDVLAAIADTSAQITTVRRESITSATSVDDAMIRIDAWIASRDPSRQAWEHGMDLVSELRRIVHADREGLSISLEGAERSAKEALDDARRLRLLPAESLFPELGRAVRDAAAGQSNRSVAFETTGGELRIDANVLVLLRDALVQLLRNAIAHAFSFSHAGTHASPSKITLSFERVGTRGVVSVKDNGRGLDLAAIREALVGRGVPRETVDEAQSASAVMQIVMRRGGSTKATASELAGRGVGLQVIGNVMDRLRGTMTVTTKEGEGTEFRLDVPLSVTAAPALIVEIDDLDVSIPLDSVLRTARIATKEIVRSPSGDVVIEESGAAIPFASLSRALKKPQSKPAGAAAVVWTTLVHLSGASGERAAIGVDRIIGVENEVVLPVPNGAVVDPIVVGAALDGYGDPRLALDPRLVVQAVRKLSGLQTSSSSSAMATDTARNRKKRVLVIDDSLTSRMLEESILDAAGYEVTTATCAEEGLEIARKSPDGFALFVVDVEMPGMNGFEYVAATRADPALASTPAVLVTSRAAPEDRRRGLEAGARAYIVKGEFAQDAFLDAVRRLVG